MLTKVLKANGVYAIGSAANGIALFLLIPYLINHLSPTEYGAWALFEVGIMLLTMVVLMGLDVGLMREYWFLTDETSRARLTGTIIGFVTVWGGLLVVVLSALATTLSHWWKLPETPQTLLLATASGFFEALLALWLTLFRIRERAFTFAALSCGRMLLFLSGAILFVRMGMGLSGALAGRLLAASIALVVAVAIGRQHVHWTFDMVHLRRVARYGLPLLPTNLATYVLLASDRYILQSFSTLEVVGIYTFAYKIATTLDVLITRPFAIDWAPRRFKIATASDAPRKYALILLGYLFVGTLAALLIVAVTPAIYQWIAPVVYHQGMAVVPIILAAYLIYGLSYPLNVGIMLKDKTVYLALLGIASAGICLALNFWLIPMYGMMGAAYATLIAYLLWTGGIAWVSLRLYPVPYSLRLLLLIGLNAILCYAGIHVLGQGGIGDGKSIMHSVIKLIWVLMTFSGLGYVLTRKTGVSIFARSKPTRQVEPL